MGRKAKGGGRRRGGKGSRRDDDDDDNTSVTSATETVAEGGDGTATVTLTASDAIDQALEKLANKRYTTRQTGLRELMATLQKEVAEDALSSVLVSTVSACVNAVRRGKAAEAELGARALGLVAVTMGADQESIVTDVMAPLMKSLTKKSLGAEAHAAVIRALAVSVFVCSNETTTTDEVAELCWKIVTSPKVAPRVRAQAIASYTFLATIRSQAQLVARMDEALPVMLAMLEHPNVAVRVAAGIFVAMLFSAQHAQAKASDGSGGDDDGDDDDDDTADAGAVAADAGAGGAGGGAGAGAGAGAGSGSGSSGSASAASGAKTAGAAKAAAAAAAKAAVDDAWASDEEYENGYGGDDGGADGGGAGSGDDDSDNGGSESEEEEEEDKAAGTDWVWHEVIGWGSPNTRGVTLDNTKRAELHASVTELLRKLSKDSAKHRSRKEKRGQRAIFRDVYRSVQEGDEPETPVRIRTSSTQLFGWPARVQMETLKNVLTAGMQTHLEFNSVMRDILGLTGEVARGATAFNKRTHFSPYTQSTRARQSDRASKRFTKQASRHAFLHDD